MKNRSALKLTEEERDFLHNKDGLSKLEKKSLSPFSNKNNVIKSKRIGKKKKIIKLIVFPKKFLLL